MVKKLEDYFVHESAIIDEGATVGAGSKLWHFTHVSSGAKIGEKVVLGQNVFIAARAAIGSRCRCRIMSLFMIAWFWKKMFFVVRLRIHQCN